MKGIATQNNLISIRSNHLNRKSTIDTLSSILKSQNKKAYLTVCSSNILSWYPNFQSGAIT